MGLNGGYYTPGTSNGGDGTATGGSLGVPDEQPLSLPPVRGMSKTNVGGDYEVYTPDAVAPQWGGVRTELGQLINRVQNAPVQQMNAQGSFGAQIDPTQQAQFRQQQMSLGQTLAAQANGQGPSVAGSQLQQSTEQNLQAALAQASSARGGNLGAMQYQLGNNRANIQQQAAMGLAQNRIQEQMAARSQLGQVLNEGRGADIGLATNQAGMTQQNNQFNAGQSNMVGAQNLQAGINQSQFANNQLAQLLAQGFSMDQAATMLQLGQGQFASQVLNQGVAAQHGVALQQSGQATQLGGAAIGAAGSVLAGLAK